MSGSIFQNGNRRVFRLTVYKLAAGMTVITLLQVQSQVHNLDFLSERTKHMVVFGISTLLILNRSIEMFFDQTIQLFKQGMSTGDTQFLLKPEDTQKGK